MLLKFIFYSIKINHIVGQSSFENVVQITLPYLKYNKVVCNLGMERTEHSTPKKFCVHDIEFQSHKHEDLS